MSVLPTSGDMALLLWWWWWCVYGTLSSELSGVVPPLLLRPSSFRNFCSAKLVMRTRALALPAEPPEDDAGLADCDLGSMGREPGPPRAVTVGTF